MKRLSCGRVIDWEEAERCGLALGHGGECRPETEMKVDRPRDWWLQKAQDGGSSEVGVGQYMDGIPDRCRLDRATPAELAIRAAMAAVEALPPDERLTQAGNFLTQALKQVADFVEDPASPQKAASR